MTIFLLHEIHSTEDICPILYSNSLFVNLLQQNRILRTFKKKSLCYLPANLIQEKSTKSYFMATYMKNCYSKISNMIFSLKYFLFTMVILRWECTWNMLHDLVINRYWTWKRNQLSLNVLRSKFMNLDQFSRKCS